MLGQRIDLLKKAKAGPHYSKEKRKKVLDLLTEFDPLLAIRADIAHGRLHLVQIESEVFACFINVRFCVAATHIARLITLSQFATLGRQLKSIFERLLAKD